MLVRQALESDRQALLALGRQLTAEKTPHLVFDEARANRAVDNHLACRNIAFFVVEEGEEVIGFLGALLNDYMAHAGFSVAQELFYVRPDKRGTRAAASLFAEFNRWADSLGPEEVFAGIATGHRPAVAARWMRRFGFEPVGPSMRRLVNGKAHVR